MRSKDIYYFKYPYEEIQGEKYRPILVFVLTSTPNEFIGLKITTKYRKNRIKIRDWKNAGLSHQSYVQCDQYGIFKYSNNMKYICRLSQFDYDRVVLKFLDYYPILKPFVLSKKSSDSAGSNL